MPARKYIETFPDNDKDLGYICGLLATDGCLASSGKSITLCLHRDDFSTLEWVAKKLMLNPSIRCRNDNRNYYFSSSLPKLYQYCLDIGITPTKSLTLDVDLDNKSEEFKWYFLRGCLDGDGYISRLDSTKCNITLSTSSIKFASTISNLFNGTVYTKDAEKNKSGKYKSDHYHVSWNYNKAKSLAALLPKEDYMMSRKSILLTDLNKFQYKNSGYRPKKEKRNNLTAGMVKFIRNLYSQGGWSYSKLARMFNVSSTCIGLIVTRKNWAKLPNDLDKRNSL